jgi:hypothetical protein
MAEDTEAYKQLWGTLLGSTTPQFYAAYTTEHERRRAVNAIGKVVGVTIAADENGDACKYLKLDCQPAQATQLHIWGVHMMVQYGDDDARIRYEPKITTRAEWNSVSYDNVVDVTSNQQ